MRSVVTVGHGVTQQVEIVEARDGDAAGNGPAAALAFEQRADRQHVAGEEAGIDVGMRLDQAHQRIGALAKPPGASSTRPGSAGRPSSFSAAK